MATMWPKEIPVWVLQDERRTAEVKVFNKLKDVLDNSWTVYYSRPWWGINLSGGEIDGEADFIIAHPENGVLFIEVKGGRISYQPEYANWYSTDRLDIRHRIKNPVEQAKTCRYRFFEKLRVQKSWPNVKVRMHYGVIFTDTAFPIGENNIGGYDAKLFCHSEVFENELANWILGRLVANSNDGEIGPGKDGILVLHNLVARPVNLSTTLQRDSETTLNQINNLFTGAQLQILTEIVDEYSVVIEGGAGTGKTVIAIELAIRLSETKHNIYFVAVGAALIGEVTRKLLDYSNIKVMGEKEFYSNQMQNNIQSKDAIIIDEGQDFNNNFWNFIEQLKIEKNFALYVFTDSNQSVYRSPEDLSIRLQAKRITLRLNLRNTKNISKLTSFFYTGPFIHSYAPNGTNPEIMIEKDLDNSIEKVMKLILRLTKKEGVKLSSIAVLSKNTRILEKLKLHLSSHKILFSPADKFTIESVTLDSVSRFKGMESPFVILIADRELADHKELSYVALSRARSHLFIVGNIDGTKLRLALQSFI